MQGIHQCAYRVRPVQGLERSFTCALLVLFYKKCLFCFSQHFLKHLSMFVTEGETAHEHKMPAEE